MKNAFTQSYPDNVSPIGSGRGTFARDPSTKSTQVSAEYIQPNGLDLIHENVDTLQIDKDASQRPVYKISRQIIFELISSPTLGRTPRSTIYYSAVQLL